MLLLLSKRRHPFISKKRLWTCVRARYERNGNMWESVLWLAVIGLIQIVTFFVMVMFVRMAIREHKRELAQMTSYQPRTRPKSHNWRGPTVRERRILLRRLPAGMAPHKFLLSSAPSAEIYMI
jgi:hypothetical protein